MQEVDLRARPDIVIGTPGRLIDHLQNSPSVHFDNVDILVRRARGAEYWRNYCCWMVLLP